MTAHKSPLGREARLLLLVVALQFVGTGLALPLNVVYLHEARGFELETAGILLALPPLTALAFLGPAGLAVDRFGAKWAMMLNLAVFAVSSVLFAFASAPWVAAVSLVANGLAQGFAWPAFQALVAAAVPSSRRPRYYGLNFTLLNVGVGVGGLIGSAIVDVDDLASFRTIYIIDAVGYLTSLLLVAGPLRRMGNRRPQAVPADPGPAVRYRDLARQPLVVSLFALGFMSSFVGISQLRTGMPAFARAVGEVPPHVLGLIFTVDTLVIVGAQMFVLRRLEGRRRTRALALMGLVWAVAWTIMALTGTTSSTGVATMFALTFALVFGLGETLRPIIPSLVNDLAPDHLRGRYNAVNAAGFQLAGVLAAPIAGFLIGGGHPSLYVAVLVGAALTLAVFSVVFLERRLPPAINGMAPHRTRDRAVAQQLDEAA